MLKQMKFWKAEKSLIYCSLLAIPKVSPRVNLNRVRVFARSSLNICTTVKSNVWLRFTLSP